jgi:predicted alpha/beta-hydrolase family hydrolase
MNTLWQCPEEATAVLVLAHGAGAGMQHRSMQAIADALARRRFDFPFIEARRRVDSTAVSLHPPGKAGTERARHLSGLGLPMLFLSGTRDTFADKVLIESVVSGLPMAPPHWLDTANHGYKVLKRSRQTEEDVFDEMARGAGDFIEQHQRRRN